MPSYKCHYEFASESHPNTSELQIHAETPDEAYAEYLNQIGVRQIPVVVSGFVGAKRSEYFDNHVRAGHGEVRLGSHTSRSEKSTAGNVKKDAEDKAEAKLGLLEKALASETKSKSYLELAPQTRLAMSSYINELIAQFENRGLEPAEIKFIDTWINIKDRSLGESLIAKRFASLPAAERSSSRFGNMMLLGMMANTTRLENALDDVQGEISSIGDEVGEIQEDVGDMHEGFGFDE